MVTKKTQIEHVLIPKHEKISAKEKQLILDKYNISTKQLPKILNKDPAIQHLKVEEGDIIKISRKSTTAGEAIFYRVVSNV